MALTQPWLAAAALAVLVVLATLALTLTPRAVRAAGAPIAGAVARA